MKPQPAERALREASADVVAFGATEAALRAGEQRAIAADKAALAHVQDALDRARAAYLELRWDAMIEALAVGPDALEVLARKEHRAALWELALQRGIAHLFRKKPGDAERAVVELGFAISVDPQRRPSKGLHGPDIVSAYADALAARSKLAAQPVSIAVEPASATVTVDGVPRLSDARGVSMAPGLHVVRAHAPGYDARAVVVDTRERDRVSISLPSSSDAVASLGRAWATGELSGDAAAERRALLAVARDAGAGRVVLLKRDRARVVDGRGVHDWVTGASTADAAVRAVVPPADTAPAPAPAPAPVYKRWWFWAAAAGVVIGASAVGYAASVDRTKRWRVFAGDP